MTNEYCHYRAICRLFSPSINRLIYKMSENSEKHQSQQAQREVFKLIVLSDQESKTKRKYIYRISEKLFLPEK